MRTPLAPEEVARVMAEQGGDMNPFRRLREIEPRGEPLLSDEELAHYVETFTRTGFRGGVNWYRNFDRNWELLAPFADLRIRVPALFIGGLHDPVVTGPELSGEGPAVKMLGAFCDDLRGKVLIEDAGHWTQQEAPEETNEALIEFLSSLEY
jgi:pimeloyl-ACP methyl ester carboxylesterase